MSLLQMLLLIGGSTSIAVSSKFYTHWQQWERERKKKGAATKLQVSCRRLGWGRLKWMMGFSQLLKKRSNPSS
jgi:hypothetical protein